MGFLGYHYSAITWTPSLANQLFVQQHVQADNKGNSKALHCYPSVRGNLPVTGGFPSQRVSNTITRLNADLLSNEHFKWTNFNGTLTKTFFFQEIAFENVISTMAVILFMPQNADGNNFENICTNFSYSANDLIAFFLFHLDFDIKYRHEAVPKMTGNPGQIVFNLWQISKSILSWSLLMFSVHVLNLIPHTAWCWQSCRIQWDYQ